MNYVILITVNIGLIKQRLSTFHGLQYKKQKDNAYQQTTSWAYVERWVLVVWKI